MVVAARMRRRRKRRAAFALISFLADELAIEGIADEGAREGWLGREGRNDCGEED